MEGVTWKLTAVVVFDCGDSAIDGPPLDAASFVVPRCRSESKEAPLAELLFLASFSSLFPATSPSFFPKTTETLAPPLAVDADAVSHPGRIESHGKLRLVFLGLLV